MNLFLALFLTREFVDAREIVGRRKLSENYRRDDRAYISVSVREGFDRVSSVRDDEINFRRDFREGLEDHEGSVVSFAKSARKWQDWVLLLPETYPAARCCGSTLIVRCRGIVIALQGRNATSTWFSIRRWRCFYASLPRLLEELHEEWMCATMKDESPFRVPIRSAEIPCGDNFNILNVRFPREANDTS